MTLGGLGAFAGREVVLTVYVLGKDGGASDWTNANGEYRKMTMSRPSPSPLRTVVPVKPNQEPPIYGMADDPSLDL